MIKIKAIKRTITAFFLLFSLLAPAAFVPQTAFASDPIAPGDRTTGTGTADVCGAGKTRYQMSINIGCQGKGNPITDATFAIIRFLSYGVGLVLVGSLVFAGLQYITSRGDPKATAEAVNRIQSTVGALLLFIFGFTILNYLIPAGILK